MASVYVYVPPVPLRAEGKELYLEVSVTDVAEIILFFCHNSDNYLLITVRSLLFSVVRFRPHRPFLCGRYDSTFLVSAVRLGVHLIGSRPPLVNQSSSQATVRNVNVLVLVCDGSGDRTRDLPELSPSGRSTSELPRLTRMRPHGLSGHSHILRKNIQFCSELASVVSLRSVAMNASRHTAAEVYCAASNPNKKKMNDAMPEIRAIVKGIYVDGFILLGLNRYCFLFLLRLMISYMMWHAIIPTDTPIKKMAIMRLYVWNIMVSRKGYAC